MGDEPIACENLFCLYWSDDQCILDRVTLDIQACCKDCEYVQVEERQLDRLRRRQLREQLEREEKQS